MYDNTARPNGCVHAIGLLIALVIVLWMFSPPREAREAAGRLNASNYPDPAERIKGVTMIRDLAVEGQWMSGWQQLQTKGCQDADPGVRAACLQALAEITVARPDYIKTNWGAVYLDPDFLTQLGKTDDSPKVRIAAADFWARADVLSDEGIAALAAMLDGEHDQEVIAATKRAFSLRLDRSLQIGKVDSSTSNGYRQKYKLPSGTADR